MIEVSEDARSKLKEVFGYDEFRPLQEEIISSLLAGRDSMVIMPTGGGKSICYQIPALLFEKLTVVVSPLISLMKDQVGQLTQAGVPAAFLNSSLDLEEYHDTLLKARSGGLKILYAAPETICKPNIINELAQTGVSCLAIDEAHCVSEWGHDFRPEYRQLAALREQLGNPVYIALTATATERVQSDIESNLGLVEPEKYVASFNRENLFLEVRAKGEATKQVLQFLVSRKNESGIIYCFSRKKTESLCEKLVAQGHSALPYHAGLSAEVRQRNQDQFIRDEVQIMVATVAFGMGIDKSNVRFVIHADLPKNIESYYQEIGRAGRDSLKSSCLLLFSPGDMGKIQHFIGEKPDEQERIIANQQLDAMVQYAEAHVCRRIPLLGYFSESAPAEGCGMCDNCLEPKQLADITVDAQKFLSCVHRVRQRFGTNYIIDVLRGSDMERIRMNLHDQLSTHGIGKDYSKVQWKNLARQFITQGLAKADLDNYGVLTITERGQNVLKGELKVEGIVVADPEGKKRIAKLAEPDYDAELFELLRSKRKELASAASVPPYLVFSDKSLVEMAAYLPKDEETMLQIHGVGFAKLELYGQDFIEVIKEFEPNQPT